MNIDTDLQYAFTEGIRDYIQDKSAYLLLKLVILMEQISLIKNIYDPRKWLREGEETFKARLKQAFEDLNK